MFSEKWTNLGRENAAFFYGPKRRLQSPMQQLLLRKLRLIFLEPSTWVKGTPVDVWFVLLILTLLFLRTRTHEKAFRFFFIINHNLKRARPGPRRNGFHNLVEDDDDGAVIKFYSLLRLDLRCPGGDFEASLGARSY